MRQFTSSDIVRARIAALVWLLCLAVLAYTAENLWLDSWLREKSHNRLPSFIPEPLSGTWAVTCGALLVALVLAAVCQLLIWRARSLSLWKRIFGSGGLVAAAILFGMWFLETSGMCASLARKISPSRQRSVTLRWNASTSPVVGYNVYRRTREQGVYGLQPINPGLVKELTYIDAAVQGGVIYFYVVRAVDTKGRESTNSNEAEVLIPGE